MLRRCRTEAFTPSALRRCVCPCWSVYKKHKVSHSAATMNTDDVPTGLELSAVLVKEEEAGGLESEETEPAEAEESKPIAAAEGDELLDDEASTPASVNVEIPYDDDRAIPRFSLRRAVKFAGAPRFTGQRRQLRSSAAGGAAGGATALPPFGVALTPLHLINLHAMLHVLLCKVCQALQCAVLCTVHRGDHCGGRHAMGERVRLAQHCASSTSHTRSCACSQSRT